MKLYADVQITRRYRLHHVLDDAGTLAFSAATLGAVLAWLHEEGYTSVSVDDGERSWQLHFKPETE